MAKKTELIYGNTLINQGGLMRCCLETLYKFINEHYNEQTVEGMRLDCLYETRRKAHIVLENNVWKWDNYESKNG